MPRAEHRTCLSSADLLAAEVAARFFALSGELEVPPPGEGPAEAGLGAPPWPPKNECSEGCLPIARQYKTLKSIYMHSKLLSAHLMHANAVHGTQLCAFKGFAPQQLRYPGKVYWVR